MKKNTLLFFVICLLISVRVKAQDNPPPAWDYLNTKQINPYINIQLGKQHENFMDGQAHVGVINNISTHKLHVTGIIFATLTCGNQVSSVFDVTLNPGTSAGGGNPALLNDDGLGGHAMNTDCLGEKKYTDPNNPNIYYLDRIRTVGIKNLQVTIVDDKVNSLDSTHINVAASVNIQRTNQSQQLLRQKKQQDSLKSANQRIASINAASQANQALMGTAAIGVMGAASLMKDQYSGRPVFLKYYLGLGIDQLPIIGNFNDGTSETRTSTFPTVDLGLRLGILNNTGVSLQIAPLFSYGVNILTGETGSDLVYGGMADLLLSVKNTSLIKLFAEGGYINRNGNFGYDQNAVIEAGGLTPISNNDVTETANYKYSQISYGGGIMFHFINTSDLTETYLKPGILFERPSFFQSGTKPTMVGNLQVLISSFIMFDISYSKNYFVVGSSTNGNFTNTNNQSYFSIKIVKTGKIL